METQLYTEEQKWNAWQEALHLEDLKEQQMEQSVIDDALAEMEEDRQQALFENWVDMNSRDYHMLALEQEIHDFVNSVEGRIQEDQYFLDIENGWKQAQASMPEISRKVKQLQQQISDLASLLEEVTGY